MRSGTLRPAGHRLAVLRPNLNAVDDQKHLLGQLRTSFCHKIFSGALDGKLIGGTECNPLLIPTPTLMADTKKLNQVPPL